MTGKIKILLILPQQQAGGAEIQLLNLIHGIDKKRFTVHLGFLYQNNELRKEFSNISDVEIVNFNKSGKFDIGVYFRIARFIKEKNIDIIQTFLSNHHAYLPSFIAKRSAPLGGIRSTFYNDKAFFNNIIKFGLLKIFSRFKDMHLVSNSYAGKEIYVRHKFPEDKIFVVPNGIDYKKFSHGNGKKILKEFSLQKKLVLGMVSRIDKRKNHEELIEVFSELCVEHKNIVLMLVGSGPYLSELKKIVSEKKLDSKVIFTGLRRDINDILSACDIFVFPSKFPEGWPNAVGEAMSAGTPVISYPCGDVSHIITTDYDGIITAQNKTSLKKSLQVLISDKNLRRRFSVNGKKTILSKFTIPIMVKKYEEIYYNILKKN